MAKHKIDPVVARERASKAGRASLSTDGLINRLHVRAEYLTPEQRDKLAKVLEAAGGGSK